MSRFNIIECTRETFISFFKNLKGLFPLLLQFVIIGILLNVVVAYGFTGKFFLTDFSRYGAPKESIDLLELAGIITYSLFMALVALPMHIALSRQIVLDELPQTNLLATIATKRYWLYILATLKVFFATLGLMVVFAGVLTGVYFGLKILLGITLSLPITITLAILLFLPFIFFLASSFLYTPLLAALDGDGYLSTSWKLTQGYRFKIAITVILTILMTLVLYIPIALLIGLLAFSLALVAPQAVNAIQVLQTLFSTMTGLLPIAMAAVTYKKIVREV